MIWTVEIPADELFYQVYEKLRLPAAQKFLRKSRPGCCKQLLWSIKRAAIGQVRLTVGEPNSCDEDGSM